MSIYIAIDLKSFYASVECVEHGFDPLNTNLVVADESRTEKTICLAVSPSLKGYGVASRPRLFEVVEQVRKVNLERRKKLNGSGFIGDSFYADELAANERLAVNYFVAEPRMSLYLDYSSRIYKIYLKYFAKEDIHVYSIDEVFIDVTSYLKAYQLTPRELTRKIIAEVLAVTGITATAGIGPNLYLAKVAMDIVAKKLPADKDGVRIAEIDEYSYRELLWEHMPLTDFWRVGPGIASKLINNGMYTMGDVAEMSLRNEDKLFKLFGINAELLIDHAWGVEPVGMKEIKGYVPLATSLSSGQVLSEPYPYEKALLVIKEMADQLVLDLTDKGMKTDQIVLSIGYDKLIPDGYQGEKKLNHYGQKVPRSAHGSINLESYSSSMKAIAGATEKLFAKIVDPQLFVRRMVIVANHLLPKDQISEPSIEQLDLFADAEKVEEERKKKKAREEKEDRMQEAILKIHKKYGKNALLKANSLQEGATGRARNKQIGGHKA